MKTTNSAADNFYETLKKDPKKIIKWAEDEIREYKRLIKLIKEGVKTTKGGLNENNNNRRG